MQSLSAFLGDTNSKSYQWHNQATQKLARIQGYPVSIKLDWFVQAQACPAPEQDDDDSSLSSLFSGGNPIGALKGMIGDAVTDEAKQHVEAYFQPDPDTPIVHWDRTISTIQMQQVSADVFELPAGFTQKPMPSLESAEDPPSQ